MGKTKNWSSGLCSCCADINTCCYGFWCCPCLACNVAGNFGENSCLPVCDVLSPAVFAACGIPLCVPPAALSLRSAMRNKYDIKGSLCNDIVVSCFCVCCSWCQMHRQLKHKDKKETEVVHKQPQTVINLQTSTSTSMSVGK
ncbi:cornifelin homolog B-like [Nematolebias whitei]|uniref:cornifelin homolog B-like n=1 Tax=Nematolebias whitei TaxID=451745 RepID=UPI00189B8BEA|nr:cornifelin homolog B-like [Nematolebias whitei]